MTDEALGEGRRASAFCMQMWLAGGRRADRPWQPQFSGDPADLAPAQPPPLRPRGPSDGGSYHSRDCSVTKEVFADVISQREITQAGLI